MLLVGSKVKLSTAYHPQTDGQTERTNRTFEDMLRCYATVYQEDWVRPLPMLEFCYNDTVHNSTGYTPFFLTTGRHPHTPSSFLHGTHVRSVNEDATQHFQSLAQHLQRAKDAIQQAQRRQTRLYDQKRQRSEFERGALVMLSTRHLRPQDRAKHKLDDRWIGPFEVLDDVSPAAYRLNLPRDMQRIHPVFHVSYLKEYIGPRVKPVPSRFVTDDAIEEEEFDVQEILDEAYMEDNAGKKQRHY